MPSLIAAPLNDRVLRQSWKGFQGENAPAYLASLPVTKKKEL